MAARGRKAADPKEAKVSRSTAGENSVVLICTQGEHYDYAEDGRPGWCITQDLCTAPDSYQLRERLTICTTDNMTGTSTSTPTTVASAAPD